MSIVIGDRDRRSVRALISTVVFVFALVGAERIDAIADPVSDDTPIVAVIDQARLVKLPIGAQTLIIGNPTIADVTLLRQNNLMVLTPKAFGQTNFIALDAQGTPLAQSTIEVVNGTNALVVQRGMERQSYSCAPKCQPIERLGDDDKYLSTVAAAAQSHTARLAGTVAPTGLGAMNTH